MQLLPESFSNAVSALVPASSAALTKAVSPETLQRIPAPIAARRDEAFSSNDMFADVAAMENFLFENEFTFYNLAQLFLCHDLCYTPITIKTQAQYGAILEVVRDATGGAEVITDHPFLRVINDPNDNMHDQDLYEAWTVHQNLWGKFIQLLIRDISLDDLANPAGKIIGLMPIRPDQIKKKYEGYGENKKFVGYEFRRTPYARPRFVHPDSVMFDVYYNPVTSETGVSPTKVVSTWLHLDTALTRSNQAFIAGGGMPALIFSLNTALPDGTFKNPETIMKEIKLNKEAWDNQYRLGGNRFRKPAFVAGMEPFFQENSIEAQILDAFYNRVESRVARAFGVPAQSFMAGLEHGDSKANSGEANNVFAEQVVWTQLERMRMRLQRSVVFTEYARPGEYLRWNTENCKIFHYQRLQKQKSMREDFRMGFLMAGTMTTTFGYPDLPKELQGLNYFQLVAQSRPTPVIQNNGNGGSVQQKKKKGSNLNETEETDEEQTEQ